VLRADRLNGVIDQDFYNLSGGGSRTDTNSNQQESKP
jgi:hypothetical protein